MSKEHIIELEREVSDLRREIGWLRENCEELSKRLHRLGEGKPVVIMGSILPQPASMSSSW